MRFRLQMRTLMVGVAIVAAGMGVANMLRVRGQALSRSADYHHQASSELFEAAGGPLLCNTGMTEKEVEAYYCSNGAKECEAYHAAKYHAALAKKYEAAAARPWCWVPKDPPAPPCAFPKLGAPNPYHDKLVRMGLVAPR